MKCKGRPDGSVDLVLDPAEADLLRRGGMFQAALERMASVCSGAAFSATS